MITTSEPRRIEIDFSWGDDPLVTWLAPGGQAMEKPPALNLAAGEAEQFHIWAKAYEGAEATWHEWSFELQLLVEGVRQLATIDDGGGPFVTVTPGPLPVRFNAAGSSEWRDSLD